MSKLYVNEIDAKTSGNNIIAKQRIIPPAGGIIQIQYDQYTGTSSQSSGSQTDTALDNLSVSITPTSTSSIIKLEAHVFFEPSTTVSEYNNLFFFYRDSTKLSAPASSSRPTGITLSTTSFYSNDASSTPSMAYLTYYDTPSTTSAINYKVGTWFYGAVTFYMNRSVTDADGADYERGISLISATEIAG